LLLIQESLVHRLFPIAKACAVPEATSSAFGLELFGFSVESRLSRLALARVELSNRFARFAHIVAYGGLTACLAIPQKTRNT
jgi:hypothetical protein